MAYHEQADLVPRVISSVEFVQLVQDDGADEVSEDGVALYEAERADADALIDSYLGTRYELPLAEVPALVRRLSVRLTRYNLYARRYPEGVPEGIRTDFGDAMKLLDRIASGDVTLGIQPAASPNTERIVNVTTHTGLFRRGSLKGSY